jgi:hypothetical protein
MMTRSKQTPVSSFGADLHATLREGANKELRLKFDSEALCTRFMHRLNALRAAMKRESTPGWQELYRCGIHKAIGDKKTLILAPRDSEFREVIKAAGIDLSTPIAPVVEYSIHTPVQGEPNDPAEDFLATLRDATTVPKK